MIVRLEASDDSRIKRLNVWCEIRFEIDKLNVGGLVCDHMAREVIKGQSDMLLFTAEVLVVTISFLCLPYSDTPYFFLLEPLMSQ